MSRKTVNHEIIEDDGPEFAFNPADAAYNTSEFVAEEAYGKAETKDDPYYDHSRPVTISPETVNGRTQKMHVTFKDHSFRQKYHVQWIEESKISEYEARGFQLVNRDWLASSWCHALTGSGNDLSDKVRMAVGVAEGGATQYNLLVFTTKDLFDRIETATHNEFNRLLTSGSEALNQVQKSVLDVGIINRKR